MAAGGRFDGGQTWGDKGRVDALNRQRAQDQEKKRALLASMAGRGPGALDPTEAPPFAPTARGLTKPHPTPLGYGRTQAGTEALVAADGVAALEILRASVQDRRDRVVLAWPGRTDNGFVAAALYLLEGRARGWHGHATLAVWPWRPGITWSARSIFVEPPSLVACARAAAEDLMNGVGWTKATVDHNALNIVHLRLRDLVQTGAAEPSPVGYRVRRPSLLELTSVFPPRDVDARAPYQPDGSAQILQRVRTHTRIKQMGQSGEEHLRALSDPERAPLAVFGLPVAKESALKRYLAFERFPRLGLDVVVADLTRTSLSDMGDNWPAALGNLLRAVRSMAAPRPAVVVLAEDVFVMRKAEAVFRDVAHEARVQGKAYLAEGLLLRHPGFLAAPRGPAAKAGPVAFRADIKDGALLRLRDNILGAARDLVQAGAEEAAAALRSALSFVRLIANLPVGYAEAKAAIDILHGTDDDRDQAVRSRFYLDGGLATLNIAIHDTPAHRDLLRGVHEQVCATVSQWEAATPISLKLKRLVESGKGDPDGTLLVLPDRTLVDLFLASDLALHCPWGVTAAKTMLEAARASGARRWLVVRPTSDSLKAILTSDLSPERVDILGDAAGSALLAAELAPISRLPAFAPYAGRAAALLEAIGRGSSDLRADEAELALPLPAPTRELDFTQSGDAYSGPILKLTTQRGHSLLYRPSSDVLRHTPDELRAFECAEAQRISEGDHVVVMTRSLMEALRQELARAPKTVETLRQYHKAVADRRAILPGQSRRDKARHLLRLIQAQDASFGADELDNVYRWIDVDETTLNDPAAQPQAPRTRRRFELFADALGMPSQLSNAYWDYGIRATRSYRVREGLLFHQRAVQFVVEPESLMARHADRDLRALWQAIMDSVDAIVRKELVHAR